MITKKRDTKILSGAFGLCWLILVFIGYLYIHKPFSPGELMGILSSAWRTLIALGILSLAGGIGMLTRIREWGNLPPLTRAMLASAIGLGGISVFILIIGSAIGANLLLWLFLLVIGIVLRKQIVLWLKYWQNVNQSWREANTMGRIGFFMAAIILAYQYIEALAPPFHFDALTYHLALPAAYLQNGRIVYIPDNIFWGMPQLVEMLYMLTMSLGGVESAPVLGWWIGVITLIGLTDFAKKIYGPDATWTAAAGLLAGSGLTTSLSNGYIEWGSMLFGLSVLICLFRWMAEDKNSALNMAGLLTGMAVSVKYTNGVILIAGFATILLLKKSHSWKQPLLQMMRFGGATTLIMLPWMIKNVLATFNPFYPLFIPGGAMDATLLDFYQFKPLTQDWSRLILLPLQATIYGIDNGEGFSSSIGPLLLGAAPLALINWKSRSSEQRIIANLSAVTLVIGFLIWAIGSQFRGLLIQTRLYFVIFPAWALLVGAGYMSIARINSHNIRFRNLAGSLILLAIAFNTFSTITSLTASNPIPAILNREKRAGYLKRHLGTYEDAMQMMASLPDSARIIMLWETRSLECLPKCDPDEIIGRWYHDWSTHHNPDQIIRSWRNQGYTHVLLNHTGADFIRNYDVNAPSSDYWDGLQTTMESLVPVDSAVGGYRLYQLP